MKVSAANLHTIRGHFPVSQERAVSEAIEKIIRDAQVAETPASGKVSVVCEAKIDIRLEAFSPTPLQQEIDRIRRRTDILMRLLYVFAALSVLYDLLGH
jgi:hypothetical protein